MKFFSDAAKQFLIPEVDEAMESRRQEREIKRQASKRNDEGMALESFGQYEEALKANEEAIRLHTEDASAYNNKGRILERLDRKAFALIYILTGHAGAVWSVAISPDSQRLASGSNDHKIKIWAKNE